MLHTIEEHGGCRQIIIFHAISADDSRRAGARLMMRGRCVYFDASAGNVGNQHAGRGIE